MYYTYVLKSRLDGKLYIGYSANLQKRIEAHRMGRVDATRGRRPLDLVYDEACMIEERAREREKYFKTGFGRRFLDGRIS